MTAPARTAVELAAQELARSVVVDDAGETVRWRGPDGAEHEAGLHDYAALYAVPGLYEAVYLLALGGRAPGLVASALADAVPAGERADLPVLDVGAGTGAVGEQLRARGFGRLAATDLEPAAETALRRDRPGVYTDVRTLDLLRRTPDDDRWLAGVAPRALTVAGAVGFGHLPVAAFAVLTGLLPAGGLLAFTAARDLATAPALAGHAALLLGPAYEQVVRREGVHRTTATGTLLPAVVLVLRRGGRLA